MTSTPHNPGDIIDDRWCNTMSEKWKEAPEALRTALRKPPDSVRHVFLGHHLRVEMFWVKHQPYLLSCGFQLRPRYHPEWVPSWKIHKGFLGSLDDFEDSMLIHRSNILDAVRVSDGAQVVIKCVDISSSAEEIQIARHLNSPELATDPKNHCVPILAVLAVPNDQTKVFLVMPQLLNFASLPFRCVGEVVEAVEQFLQGLDFMHEHRIAHRDACYTNLMMDTSKVIPRGFHFMSPRSHDGISGCFEWFERWSVCPVKYYLVDFGLSRQYPPQTQYETSTGLCGQDRTVPELLANKPYDPFKLDVYQLGNVILELIEKYGGLGVLLPIAKAMTATNPLERPSPSRALKMFGPFDSQTLCSRVWCKDDPYF